MILCETIFLCVEKRGIMSNFKRMIIYQYKFNPRITFLWILNIILTFLFTVSTLIVPRFLIQEMMNHQRINVILMTCFVFVVVAGGSGFVKTYIKYDYLSLLKEVRSSLLRDSNRKNFNRNYADLENPLKEREVNIAQFAATNFSTGFEGVYARLFTFSESAVMLMIYTVTLSSLHILLGIFLLIITILYFLYTKKEMSKVLELEQSISMDERRMWNWNDVTRDYSYGKDIRVFDLSSWFVEKLLTMYNVLYVTYKKIAYHNWKVTVLDLLLSFVKNGIVYLLLIYLILNDQISFDWFTTYFTATALFSGALKKCFEDFSFIQVQMGTIKNYYKFMDQPDEVDEVHAIPFDFNGQYKIEFCDVTFTYPGTEKVILEHLTFDIKPGEKLALVGVNGAGKTTIIKLLSRLYKPDSGVIKLNGVDINTIDLLKYRSEFSIVFQDINLYATTLAENITLSNEIDNERLEEVVEKAKLEAILEICPDGLNSQMLKYTDINGIELSGGQKQKVAIARAFYRDANILVLDEPTAALDAIAEYQLYQEFSKMSRNKTSIFISHRLASTRFCDKILLLSNEGVNEIGTHAELMKQNGLYAKMFDAQKKYYEEDVV